MVEISTSILSMEQGNEAETILALEKAKTDYFHIDVMDGKFVDKDTYNKMREYAENYIAHMQEICSYINKNRECGISALFSSEPKIYLGSNTYCVPS